MSTVDDKTLSESEDEEELERQKQEIELKLERHRKKKAVAQKNVETAESLLNPSPERALDGTKKSSDSYDLKPLDSEGDSENAAANSCPTTVSQAQATNVLPALGLSSKKSSKAVSSISVVPSDWTNAAFGKFSSANELDKRLILLNQMLNTVNQPSIEVKCFPVKVSNVNTVVCVKGKLVRSKEGVQGKRGEIVVEISSLPVIDSAGACIPESIQVVIVESGIGKEIFKKLSSALQAYSENGDQLLVVKGIVQFNKRHNATKPIICVNHKNHVVLIAVEPLKNPMVHDMDGNPIEFPMSQNNDNARKLQGTFSGAWFCPLSDSKLTKSQVDQLRQHISAYRGSGGGVIYLGLKRRRIKLDEFEIENVAVELSLRNLEGLKRQVEEACKAQCPPCCAKEWDSRELPENIKQRFDHCFNTYFTTSNHSYFVVRMIVCPSKHPLHLCSETDIGLHKRHGTTSSNYPIGEFVSIMSETSQEVSQKLEQMSAVTTTVRSTRGPAIKDGPTLALWQQMDPEGGTLDNKDLCFDDPVEKTINELEEYVAVWLNDSTSTNKGGRLRIGVSDKATLVTGVWLDDKTVASFIQRLVERYEGSLKPSNFCFPCAIDNFSLIKHRVIVRPDGVLRKSNKVLVLWLKVSPNVSYSSGFEPCDLVCRRLYCSWAKKCCPVLKKLFDLGQEHPPLVLPLNSCLRGLLPPTEGGFPVVISKPCSISPEELDKMVDVLLTHITSKAVSSLDCVVSHQFVDCDNIITDFLDADYCIMDIIVSPSKQYLLHLCKLPEFWKLDKPSEEDEEFHICGCPRRMTFQEIAMRCCDSNLAKIHLSTFFQFSTDRPILITDVGNLDSNVTKGLACIPWTLVVDFDFGGGFCPSGSTLRDLAEKDSSYVYKLTDLSLTDFGPVNSADMSDVSPVYWVKALGPSSDPVTDPNSWRLQLSPSVCKYITQACSAILSKVKVLVVWSALPVSSQFGQAVCDLCLAAQQAKMFDSEITVVCPTFASPFISKFKDLPHQPEILSIELNTLSDFLLKRGPNRNSIDDWRSVPDKTLKLSVETVRSMQAAELDYLYPNIESHLDMTSYDNGLAFFEGRARFVRWEDFKARNVVDRPETQQLYKRVKSCLECHRRDTTTVQFIHYPGAGGSTVARNVMWLLRKKFCCIVPSQLYHNLRHDVRQLIDASEGRAVLVLWDNELGIVFDELMSELNGLTAVILRVERFFENGSKANIQIHLKENLPFEVMEQFYALLCRNTHFSKSKEVLDFLMLYTRQMKEEVPLFLMMVTALENKFLRLHDYVKERLINITEEQKSILKQIAFARVYTGKALQVSAVDAKDRNWENSLPNSISGLISFFQLHSRCVRMRHHCIDAIILAELSGFENTSPEWGQWLADYAVKFIDHLRNVYPVPEWDNYGNNINEFERVLRWLFHDKSYNTQISNFESLIGNLAGKDTVITCMRNVEGKLPTKRRIQAHFLGDLARVYLHMGNMDLDGAVQVMKEAHLLLPFDRTLFHQEGQLYFDAMTLTQGMLLVPKDPLDLTNDIIKLSQKASDCYATSRDCKMQGRASELYPWSSDLQCHIKCLTDICSIMKCSFHTLPKSLATHEYILHALENIAFLLDTLSTEDPFMYNDSLMKILQLLGSEVDIDDQLKRLFLILKNAERKEKVHVGHTSSNDMAKTLQHINFLLRLRYVNARRVPEDLCTSLTEAIMNLIDQPRVINSVLAQKGHKDRFLELELLWDWSRYSKLKISRIGMLSIIDKFMENLTIPSLQRAKCLLFKGVTMLIQLLCDKNPDVNPDDITKYISECNAILENLLQNENRNWRYSEFLITGSGKELLSSKNWFWKDSLHRAINDSNELNLGYSKRTEFREFFGQVYKKSSNRYGEVTCEGLSLCFVPSNAPESWQRVNSGVVNFYISVSSQKGLQAYPVCPLDKDKRAPVTTHRWLFKQLQRGRVISIDKEKGLVYFAPPDHATQPYGAKAFCQIDNLSIRPEQGDLYEFEVTRLKVDRKSEPRFIASQLRFIEKGN